MSRRGKQNDGRERDKKLDEAIDMTFPASDPIAVGRPTGAEVAQGREGGQGSQQKGITGCQAKGSARPGGREDD